MKNFTLRNFSKALEEMFLLNKEDEEKQKVEDDNKELSELLENVLNECTQFLSGNQASGTYESLKHKDTSSSMNSHDVSRITS